MGEAQNQNLIEINVREDGVYLTITHPAGSPKVSRMEILSIIEAHGIKDVDFVSLNSMLKNETEFMDIKLSENTDIHQVDESAVIEVNKDRMEAYITFSEPINKGRLMTLDDVRALIDEQHIVNVDFGFLESLLKNKRYARKYSIAKGKLPKAGTDGFLQYHFDNSNMRPKPRIMEDGTVNFRQLDIFRLCNKGDVLVTSVPPKDGENGVDVYGEELPFPRGRQPLPIPRGKNTVVSEDGLHLIADASGHLVIQDKRINISPCLEIRGDVDNSTGNIDFNGDVTISGNVLSGFSVSAVGNIEIHGVCEAAMLTSKANIILGNGVHGADRAELIAEGDITAKFIEGCNVTAGGNIVADSILKSVVKCDGSVILAGKNGLLVGGKLIAGERLKAITLGSPAGTLTEIEVGSNPKVSTQHAELSAELIKVKSDLEKSELTINTLNALKQRKQLTDDKKNMLLKMIAVKNALRNKIVKIQEEMDMLAQILATNNGSVTVSKVIRFGVRITIGKAQLRVRDELQYCTLTNDGVKIAIGPMIEL